MQQQFDFSPQPIDKKQAQIALENEEKLMCLSGLKKDVDIHLYDVKIFHYGENFIHTCRLGDNNQENMVILHGYGGSGVTFYRIIEPLSRKYRVFTVDFLGMGLSSRPKFTLTKNEDVIEFFIESLEKWRQAVGLDRFHLVGHSLGGHLICHYAKKYPQYVVKLSLISPAGITKRDPDAPKFEDQLKKMNFLRRWVFNFIWEKKNTPNSIFKSNGCLGKFVLKRYVSGRFKRPKIESALMYEYLKNILLMPESSEKSLHYLLAPPKAFGVYPPEDFLADIDIEVDFYFGDKDWMDSTGAHRLCEKTNGRFKIIWIKNSGHQINMDNPDDLVQNIFQNAKNNSAMLNKDLRNEIYIENYNPDQIAQEINDSNMGLNKNGISIQ